MAQRQSSGSTGTRGDDELWYADTGGDYNNVVFGKIHAAEIPNHTRAFKTRFLLGSFAQPRLVQ